MQKMTRRNWLAAAGATTAVAGASSSFGQEATPANTHNYNFKDISPRELIQRRHLPNLELITQENQKVHFYTDLVKDRRVVIQFMFTRCKDVCPIITHHLVEVQRLLKGRAGRFSPASRTIFCSCASRSAFSMTIPRKTRTGTTIRECS